MPQRFSEGDIRRLAARWREYQFSLTGHAVPTVPLHLQTISDRYDAGLLLAHAPHLASPITAQRSEVSHGI